MSNKVLEARRYRPSKHPADPLQAHNCQSERFHTGIVINFAQTAVGCRPHNSSAFMARTKKGDHDLFKLTQFQQKKKRHGRSRTGSDSRRWSSYRAGTWD